jgi:sulfate adenylyltransferase
MFEKRGWKTVAALQLRNPMHRSHEYLAKLAIEIADGVFIHQLVGKLKPGDIPADVRVKAINVLVEKYFVKDRVIMGGYPLDMRYAGPREALLHALFRQNYGCSHILIGRDHAGVGEYYGPFDAHHIFEKIPKGSLEIAPLKIDWTFYCKKCDQMASMKTCPHGKEDRVLLSGTMLRKMLSEGEDVSPEFSRPEVLEVLKEYYTTLEEEEKVEIKLHKHTEGGA